MAQDANNPSKLISKRIQLIQDLHRYNSYGRGATSNSFVEKFSPELRQRLTSAPEELLPEHVSIFVIRNGGFQLCTYLLNEYQAYMLDYMMMDEATRNRLSSIGALGDIETNIHQLSRAQNEACIKNSFKEIQSFVDRGADINSSNSGGVTSLMISAALNPEICRFFIERGASINVENKRGQTALHFAVGAYRNAVVQLLLEKGADPLHRDLNGDDSLRIACCYGNLEALNNLIDKVGSGGRALQREQIEKYRRLAAFSRIRRIIFNMKLEFGESDFGLRPPSELEDLKNHLDEALALARDIFGPTHFRFYDAHHETAWCYFKSCFYDQWLRQLARNLKMFRGPDLNVSKRCQELDRMLSDIRYGIMEMNSNGTKINSLLGLDALHELMNAVIEEATVCSQSDEVGRLAHLFTLLLSMIFLDGDSELKLRFASLIRRALRLGLRTGTGRTLLMASMKEYAPVLSNQLSGVILLLEGGADVDETDENGNNVVHLLFQSRRDDMDEPSKLARTAFECGIRLDAKNRDGLETSSCLRALGI